MSSIEQIGDIEFDLSSNGGIADSALILAVE
jgi:hypothetical protein